MNRIRVGMVIGVLCILQLISKAQTTDSAIQVVIIKPYHITIGYDKTSNLIFPFAIKSVDRGSAAVLVQKAKGVENILQLKAATHNFEQTNLSVITSDGRFYSFLLDYSAHPTILNISFYKDSVKKKQDAFLTELPVNDAELRMLASKVQSEKIFLHQSTREQKMRLSLQSIYLANGSMWFNLHFKNKSLIDYKPEYVRFFLQDRKRGKRTAVQQTELTPSHVQPICNVKGRQGNDLVIGFPVFTIPRTKELIIQAGEQNGGRALTLRVPHSVVLKARLLN
jgi:conjugative transposon TraN protein